MDSGHQPEIKLSDSSGEDEQDIYSLCEAFSHLAITSPDASSDTVGSKCPATYYAISLPSSLADLMEEDETFIFTSKRDALQMINKFPGTRFREFISRDDAVMYATIHISSEAHSSLKDADEKSFKRIKNSEIVQMCRFIEMGNEAAFLEQVWSNPHCLISNSDGPSVLQKGPRYNALHIAARYRQPGMFLAILYVIQNKQFLSMLYPKDQPEMIEIRIRHLVDMYLNIPDKEMLESPLHFACKYGCEPIVAILLSYPKCDIQFRNKNGHTAKDIICQDFMWNSEVLKKRILDMFEELFYVPVIRDDMHTSVCQPCDASTVLVATSSHHTKEGSHASYCAFAGPMTLSEAMSFYALLKTKGFTGRKGIPNVSISSEEKEILLKIALTDSKKGLERVGRRFARELSIGWFEYWDILDVWFDLTSSEGLEYLNKHLKRQEDLMYMKQTGEPSFTNFINDFVEDFVIKIPDVVISRSQMYFFHLLQGLIHHMNCFIDYSYSTENEIAYIHKEVGHLLYLKLTDDNHTNLMNFQALKFFLVSQPFVVGCFEKLKWKMLICILKFALYFQTSNDAAVNEPYCTCDYVQDDEYFVYSSKSSYYSIMCLRQELTNDLMQKNAAEAASSVIDMEQRSVSGPFEEAEETNVMESYTLIPLKFLPLDFLVIRNNDGYLVERELEQLDVPDKMLQFIAFEKFFITSADGFFYTFRLLMLKYEDHIPFRAKRSFFDVFEEVMKYFTVMCDVNYCQDYHSLFIHREIALCLVAKMVTVPSEIVDKWKLYLNGFSYSIFDLHKYKVSSTCNWMHLLCVIKQFCYRLDHKDMFMCSCKYETDPTRHAVYPVNCIYLLKELRCLYETIVHHITENVESSSSRVKSETPSHSSEYFTPSSSSIVSESEVFIQDEVKSETSSHSSEYFTPSSSPIVSEKEVFFQGEMISDADIDIYRAIADARVLSRIEYPYLFKWKNLIESKLGSNLISNPTSATAVVQKILSYSTDHLIE